MTNDESAPAPDASVTSPRNHTPLDPASSHDATANGRSEGNGRPNDEAEKSERRDGGTRDDGKGDSDADTDILPGKEAAPNGVDRKVFKHGGDDKAESNGGNGQDAAAKSPVDEVNGNAEPQSKKQTNGTTVAAPTNNSSNLSSSTSTPEATRTASRAGSEPAQSRPKSSPNRDGSVKDANRKRKSRTDEPDEMSVKRRHRRDGNIQDASTSERRDLRKPSNPRSESPPLRHRSRALSLSSTNAGVQKRKKPPPIAVKARRRGSEDPGDDSDASSNAPANPQLRRLTSDQQAALSPARMLSHKKMRDRNGRTFLARACATNEVAQVRARLQERPEDVNVGDNAGNTPLQIASLEGYADIVAVLLEAGCDTACRNIDSDTPLIDAVENDHLDVIRLLLQADVDPRQANAKGEEPLDLLDTEQSNYHAIKAALEKAKARDKKRRPSEDQPAGTGTGSGTGKDSLSGASPRESPSLGATTTGGARSPPPPTSRRKKRESTRTDLLWVNPTLDNLRERAGMGDDAAVAHILGMCPMSDVEATLSAAKGGHEVCLQLLVAMGRPDPDPEPLPDHRAGYNTPMLGAIGRGNRKVLQLLLEQPGFNPTRRPFRNQTYFEIAKERKGSEWEAEYEMLKRAYDDHRRSKHAKGDSPKSARSSQAAREAKKAAREKPSTSPLRPSRKLSPGPSSDGAPARRKSTVEEKENLARKEKSRARAAAGDHGHGHGHGHSASKGPEWGGGAKHLRVPAKSGGSSREASAAVSDHEAASPRSPAAEMKPERHSDPEALDPAGAAAAAAAAGSKPRKRLVSGRALRDDEQKRRDSGTGEDARRGEDAKRGEEPKRPEDSKEHRRSKSLHVKSEDGKETRTPLSDAAKKRARPSASPSEPQATRSPDRDKKAKRRRVHSDGGAPAAATAGDKAKNPAGTSPGARTKDLATTLSGDKAKDPARRAKRDASPARAGAEHSGGAAPVAVMGRPGTPPAEKKKKRDSDARDSSTHSAKKRGSTPSQPSSAEKKARAEKRDAKRDSKRDSDARDPATSAAKKPDAATSRPSSSDKKPAASPSRPQSSDKNDKSAADAPQGEKPAAESPRKDENLESIAETDVIHTPPLSPAEREADERSRQERAAAEEQRERERLAAAEAARKAEVEEAARREAAEREAREARAAEEARQAAEKQREEEARQAAERERQQREDAERRRAAEVAEAAERERERERQALLLRQRQAAEEEERRRRAALPDGLRKAAERADAGTARTAAQARRWLPLYVARGFQLDVRSEGVAREERWVANVQVAPLLGITDLALSQCECFPPSSFLIHPRPLLCFFLLREAWIRAGS